MGDSTINRVMKPGTLVSPKANGTIAFFRKADGFGILEESSFRLTFLRFNSF